MDAFGIGSAVKGAAGIYFHSARMSGRTSALVESLKTGDVVVFLNHKEALRVKDLCSAKKVKIRSLVIRPSSLGRVPEVLAGQRCSGRLLFDHSWVEAYYMMMITQAQEDIDYWQRWFNPSKPDFALQEGWSQLKWELAP